MELSLITSENYVENVLRTESEVTPEMIARFSDPQNIRLIHAGMGMCTEAAEFVDMLKKHLFYGKPLDLVNLKEEIGDLLFYIGIAVDCLGTDLNYIMTTNINKLRARYPDGFSEDSAINRDLNSERAILEG